MYLCRGLYWDLHWGSDIDSNWCSVSNWDCDYSIITTSIVSIIASMSNICLVGGSTFLPVNTSTSRGSSRGSSGMSSSIG